MKSISKPGEPQIRTPALRKTKGKSASAQLVNLAAFRGLVHEHHCGQCSYCQIGLASPQERAIPEGERPHLVLRDADMRDLVTGWLLACPCCALEHDATFRADALRAGKAGVFAWTNPADHPSQREITATVRAMVAYLDRVAAQYPEHAINHRNHILEAFRREGYGVVGVWDGPEDFLVGLRSLVYHRQLPAIPPRGTAYLPGTSRGDVSHWVSDAWASILDSDPGYWNRSARHLVVLPWPDLARNRSFDLDDYVETTRTMIEHSRERYIVAKARFDGEEPETVAQRIKATQ